MTDNKNKVPVGEDVRGNTIYRNGFTPGPWSFIPEDNWISDVTGKHRICTPHSHTSGLTVEQRNANAHLIAASPKMYQVLEDVLDALTDGGLRVFDKDQNDYHTNSIKEVLAEARGEG